MEFSVSTRLLREQPETLARSCPMTHAQWTPSGDHVAVHGKSSASRMKANVQNNGETGKYLQSSLKNIDTYQGIIYLQPPLKASPLKPMLHRHRQGASHGLTETPSWTVKLSEENT